MKKLIMDLENDVTDVRDTAKKLYVVMEDLNNCYFDYLCGEKEHCFSKSYRESVKVRKEIADDYSRQLCEFSDELKKNYQHLFEVSMEALSE